MRLYAPPKLKGKYLQEVLDSGHITAGPMCRRFGEAVAAKWEVPPDTVVLTNSASSGFIALSCCHETGSFLGDAPWPVFSDFASTFRLIDSAPFERLALRTFTGGCSREAFNNGDGPEAWDCSHLWKWPKPPTYRSPKFILLSCYPTKPIPGGEGGVMICVFAEDALQLSEVVNCGFPGSLQQAGVRDWGERAYGLKLHMTDTQAALALEGLENQEKYRGEILKSWQFLAERLPHKEIENPYLFQLPVNWRLFEDARNAFKAAAIPTGVNFYPDEYLTLPCHGELSIEDLGRICEVAEEWGKT